MVDKDLTEISVLKSKLPSSTILLCKFHVMKYFKKKISDLNCLKDEKHELAMLVQKLKTVKMKKTITSIIQN